MMWVSQGEARWRNLDPKLVTGALIPVAVCAIVGARLYHVIDQWLYYRDHLADIVLPPYSGLGLYGGIAGAIVGIAYHCRRHHLSLWLALDVVVPGTLFAQAIARWGNFFNQELYGPPTDLPWGITIDCAHRDRASIRATPTHPPRPASTHCSCTRASGTSPGGSSPCGCPIVVCPGCVTATWPASGWSGTAAGDSCWSRSVRAGTGPCWASRPPCSSVAAPGRPRPVDQPLPALPARRRSRMTRSPVAGRTARYFGRGKNARSWTGPG